MRTFFTINQGRLRRQLLDGLGPLLVAQAAGIDARGRRGIPPSPARVPGTLRPPGGSVTAPFRAGVLRAWWLPQDRWPAPRRDRWPPLAGGHAGKKGRPSPRAGHPVTEQRSPSRGAPAARRFALAQAPPLSSDLPRRTSAPIKANGGVPRSSCTEASKAQGRGCRETADLKRKAAGCGARWPSAPRRPPRSRRDGAARRFRAPQADSAPSRPRCPRRTRFPADSGSLALRSLHIHIHAEMVRRSTR